MEKPPLVEINLELFNLKLKELIELSAPLILELLTIDPEKPEFIETMHGEKVRPLKPIVMKLIDYLNLVLKIEGLVKFESLICEKNLFEVLWVKIKKYYYFIKNKKYFIKIHFLIKLLILYKIR